MKEIITKNPEETKMLAKEVAKKVRNGGVICLVGELGSGKTTFTQGLLENLGVEGPYTSPTFLIMKEYKKEIPNSKLQMTNNFKISKSKIQNIYHFDAYRIEAEDVLNLGWDEIISNKKNIVIVEWADRVKEIISKGAIWINFEWVEEGMRKIEIKE